MKSKTRGQNVVWKEKTHWKFWIDKSEVKWIQNTRTTAIYKKKKNETNWTIFYLWNVCFFSLLPIIIIASILISAMQLDDNDSSSSFFLYFINTHWIKQQKNKYVIDSFFFSDIEKSFCRCRVLNVFFFVVVVVFLLLLFFYFCHFRFVL